MYTSIKLFICRVLWNQERISLRPYGLKVLIPFILTLFITAVIRWLGILQAPHIPYLLFLGVVMVSACYGGCRSALFATLCSVICCICLFHQSPFWELSVVLFLGEGFLLTGVFALIEEMYKQLKLREEKYRVIIEKNAEGFLMANADGDICYVCPSVQEILGYTADELNGVNLHALIHPEELNRFNLKFFQLLQNDGRSINFLQRLKTADNKYKWIEGCVNNLLKDDRVRALVFHYRNVTERINKKQQQEDFVHMASHELKSPITALKGYMQLIKLNHLKEARSKDMHLIGRMDMQLNKLLGVIDDMLDVTRIKAGELRYHLHWFSFAECVNEVVESLQATVTTHTLNIKAMDDYKIYGDKDKISQVINNLIGNAVKYSPGAATIDVAVENNSGNIVFKVKDHGIGIPKDKQKKIFERFYRVDTLPKDTFQGLGLGLYISMEIIKKHQGKMGVYSEEGKGAEFWFSLPLNEQELIGGEVLPN